MRFRFFQELLYVILEIMYSYKVMWQAERVDIYIYIRGRKILRYSRMEDRAVARALTNG